MRRAGVLGIIIMGMVVILVGFISGCGIFQELTGGDDTTPPEVVSVSPSDGSTGVPINTSIIIEFSETMDESATERAVVIVPAVDGVFIWSSQSTVLTFTPTDNLLAGQIYNVKVGTGAKDLAGNNLESPYLFIFETGSGIDDIPPGDVSNFVAMAGDGQVELSWENPSDADFAGVRIMYRTDTYPTGPDDGTEAYSGSGTSTVHTGLQNGTTYYYTIFAYDSMMNYSSGVTAQATPISSSNIPIAPSDLTATAVSESQINLSWVDNSNNENGFILERKEGTAGVYNQIANLALDVTNYTDTGLTANTTYYYRVKAYNNDGESSYSNEANATTFDVLIGYISNDAYVTNDGSNDGKNWNTEYLKFGNLPSFPSYQYYVLAQFDISTLPSNVTQAKMRFYFKGRPGTSYGYATTIAVYRNTSSWDESTVTNYTALSYDNTPVTSVSGIYWPLSTDGSYVEFDITSLYNAWKNGTYSNYGVTMRPTASTGGGGWYTCDFISSENSTYPDYVPVLIVVQ